MASYETGGVPWGEIFRRAQKEKEGHIEGASGRELGYEVVGLERGAECRLSVWDAEQKALQLSACIYPAHEFVIFSLQTKGLDGEPERRHPDLYAGRFVGFALETIEQRRGVRITTDKEIWEDTDGRADNYNQFHTNHKNSMTYEQAAGETWSGKIMQQHGFTIARHNIQISPGRIVAFFKR